MSVEEMVQGIWNEERPKGRTIVLRALLRTLSPPYGAAVALRNHLYDRGLLRQAKLPCPVVSVGNLTVGGTGKTPTVVLLASLLKEHGCRPAVLSRGYGGHAKASANVVSDGNRLLLGWREAGDEPMLIAGALPGIPVLTGPKRFLTGKTAVERFGADILILDDAFQHRSLFRNLDIVLIDTAHPFGNGYLLPRGPLREPPTDLRRADILLRTGDADNTAPLREAASLPAFRGIHRPRELVEAGTGRVSPPTTLRGRKICAFAGIGSPEAFRRGLTALGAEVVSFRAFPDHHPYDHSDIETLRRIAEKSGASLIVTTEKDGVRLTDFPDFQAMISLLRIGMEITPAGPFAELIFSRLAY
jgi:tetraacyldisaccharide 4'-kinase